MLCQTFVTFNITFTPEVGGPGKNRGRFFYVVDVLLYQRDIMVVGRMGRSEKRGKI